MKKIAVSMIFCSAVSLLSACSQTPTVEPEAIALEYSQVCKLENNGKRVSTEGFIELGSMSFCSGSKDEAECGLRFKEKPDDVKYFHIFVNVGAGASRMDELTDDFVPTDLKLRSNDNSAVSPQDKVRITGNLSTSESSTPGEVTCLIKVKKIEKGH